MNPTLSVEVSSFPLIINGSNLVSSTNNNTYSFRFPAGAVNFNRGSKVALGKINIFFSWFNITAANNNNTLSYVWYDNVGSATFNITIPDGYYSVSSLNSYLQQIFITNGHYLVDGSGNFVYYIELVENATYYSIQLISSPIPTALPGGWTNPAGLTFPAVATTPQLIIPSSNIRNYLGFNAGTYPPVVQATTYTKLSDFVPQVNTITSVILTCNLLNNRYTNPTTIIYSFTPSSVNFGDLIESSPNEYNFIEIQQGRYDEITIRILDQAFRDINIRDTNILIELLIKNPE